MVALLPLLLGLVATSAAAEHQTIHDLIDLSTPQSSLVTLVNIVREHRGLPPLCTNKKLQAAAKRHVEDQCKSDYMSNTGTDNSSPEQRVTEAKYKWQSVAENIDTGNANATAVVKWWLKGSNRDNILGEYTMVGTAYKYNEETFNKHYWVQVYATGTAEECDLKHKSYEF
ncbi:RxLR-like protein [Plasmopara halstedii]|uniref:RxLR-like protein n=1 Tax=Plasmopara halstedii TaxID=4781 RepID=A0A0P1AT17_PLAHL|nr:RxLR-like protein [Plasmopara halstedii]CEG44940.1 RxLR-like protein [Plasmopara halstedii]|eukprot:XP_024581309.1 RxLR-like protein [Plasmopara halstedii]